MANVDYQYWRIVGRRLSTEDGYISWTGGYDWDHAMEVAAGRVARGWIVDAVMPEAESVAILGDGHEDWSQNIRKATDCGWLYKQAATPVAARKPRAQVPPEIWAKPDPNMDYMAAVRAMCGQGGQQ